MTRFLLFDKMGAEVLMPRFEVRKEFPKEVRDLGHAKMELLRGVWSNAVKKELWAVKVTVSGKSSCHVVLGASGAVMLERLDRLPEMDDLGVILELFHRAKQLERTKGG